MHTPGPWEISVNSAEQYDVCAEGGGDMIADLSGTDNQEGNAYLIAAAPELLSALQEMVRIFIDADLEYGVELTAEETAAMNAGKAAILKATGGK